MMNTMQQPGPRPKMSMGFPTMQPMAAPPGVMPMAPPPGADQAAPAAQMQPPQQPPQAPPPQQPGPHGHDMHGEGHVPGRFSRVPGMADFLSPYFAGGGSMRDLHQQASAYGQSTGGPMGFGGILKNNGAGFLDYLKAHLGAAPAASVAAPIAAPAVIPPVVGG